MRTVHSILPAIERMRALGVAATTLAVIAACQGAATASPTATAAATATTAPASVTPSATATSAAGAHWEMAGTMSIGRYSPHALLLGDGRVLVVGNDTLYAPYGQVRDDSATAELWDPASGTWTTTAGLNKPRVEFAAAPLKAGGALVTGGLDQGTSGCDGGGQQSFSSTYLYDPQSGVWSRGALLHTARSAPSAAVLPDGRVVVAGGYYYTGESTTREVPSDASLAAFRPVRGGPPGSSSPGANDVVPPTVGTALATAEVYDPAADTWSATGAMKYARFGAAAVTLSDGRVLVVGSGAGVDSGVAKVDDQAYVTAEIYDPKTGRFSLAGSLPGIDWAALSALNLKDPGGAPAPEDPGALVALADGGALLVGDAGYWKHLGEVVRSFRFDPKAVAWTETGQPYVALTDEVTGAVVQTPAIGRLHAMAARLPDGRVLVAGGDGEEITSTAELYDPATNAWSALPAMPGPRAAGAIVTLRDGSLLIVGGTDGKATDADPCTGPLGLNSALRFVPGP
jgi:Kelch motif